MVNGKKTTETQYLTISCHFFFLISFLLICLLIKIKKIAIDEKENEMVFVVASSAY